MERRAAGRVVGQELGTHHHLAVPNLAEGARVLGSNADRGSPFLRQAGIIEDQDPISHRMQFQQALYAHFIQFERVPGRIGEQMLQALDGGSRDHVRNGVTRLVGQIAQ